MFLARVLQTALPTPDPVAFGGADAAVLTQQSESMTDSSCQSAPQLLKAMSFNVHHAAAAADPAAASAAACCPLPACLPVCLSVCLAVCQDPRHDRLESVYAKNAMCALVGTLE